MADYSNFPFKKEHLLLRGMLQKFASDHIEDQALSHNKEEKFNIDLFKKLAPLGLLGITVDPKYGGSGMDLVSAVIAHEEISYSDPGFCLSYLAHSILCTHNLSINGDEAQKEKYLKKLCQGEMIGAMAMSEPDMGTDLKAMKTRAVKNKDQYIINGSKMWITNGFIKENETCDLLWLYAKSENEKISSFLVSKEDKGFFLGQKIKDKLGMRSSNTAELVFKDCKIPETSLIGSLGDSWNHMMKNLEVERLCLSAISLGISKRCLKIMNDYASKRMSFKKPINEFGQIQKHIAESYSYFKAMHSYIYLSAFKMDQKGKIPRVDSDAVKLFSSTFAKKIADSAIQVLGGYGYVSEYLVEGFWRDAKLLEIGGGTVEAHQKNITYDLSKNPHLLDDES